MSTAEIVVNSPYSLDAYCENFSKYSLLVDIRIRIETHLYVYM